MGTGLLGKVFTIRELADYLKVSPSTIYRLVKDGSIPAFKVGSDWRFNIESIDRWRLGSTPAPQALEAPENLPRPLPEARARDYHERDRRAWAIEQAQALREHRAEALDWETLAKEIGRLLDKGRKGRSCI